MALDCGMKCIKHLLFAFNLLFVLVGIALIVAGAVVQTQFKPYMTVLGPTFSASAIVVIVVGAIIFLIAFLGCCGAYNEHSCMLASFATCLTIILIIEFAAAIAGFVLQNQVYDLVAKGLNSTLLSYKQNNDSKIVIDEIQREFECCGVDSPSDWHTKGDFNKPLLPDSCCRTTPCTDDNHYKQGCIDGFVGWCRRNVGIVAGVAIGICFVELLGIILSCCLCTRMKRGETV